MMTEFNEISMFKRMPATLVWEDVDLNIDIESTGNPWIEMALVKETRLAWVVS